MAREGATSRRSVSYPLMRTTAYAPSGPTTGRCCFPPVKVWDSWKPTTKEIGRMRVPSLHRLGYGTMQRGYLGLVGFAGWSAEEFADLRGDAYNTDRPQRGLGQRTPAEYAAPLHPQETDEHEPILRC